MDSTANEYRFRKINEIQKQLEAEKEKRRHLATKYKKAIKATKALDYVLAASIVGLSAAGVGLLTTIIAAPAVITTETITVGVGILFVLSRVANSKLVTKATKHEKLGDLAEEILNKISDEISIALNDDKISAEEFSLILSEANDYVIEKEKLCVTSEESFESIVQRMRQTIKNSVRKNVHV